MVAAKVRPVLAAELFFLASSSAFIDDEALAHAPRLVLVVCWRISLFLLRFVVLFAAAKLSFAAAKPLFAPGKPLFAPAKRKKCWRVMNAIFAGRTRRFAFSLCSIRVFQVRKPICSNNKRR